MAPFFESEIRPCFAGIMLVMLGLLAFLSPTPAKGVGILFPGVAAKRANRVQDKEPQPLAVKFFETNVRPVLANRCYKCHGVKKQRGGLRLDSLPAILKGGDSGPAIKPSDPDKSLLVRAIRHRETLQMPPKSKLPPQEIANLTAWVKMGAPWPDAVVTQKSDKAKKGVVFTEEQKAHWAFTRPVAVLPPIVKNHRWVKTPIDAFILAKLEAKGLEPAPPADRRSLIRRATFDLIGLPPTPREVDDFLNDKSPDAFAKVIDRLLASPHYGERWARHWLDVVRYADSNGMDENLAFVNAFRYRDYVVGAFNDDKPYDRFLCEQIAGDLLPSTLAAGGAGDGIIATGFLSLGPKMLAEDDPVKMEMDIIDEQIDTIGRTFMGLTLGCARCHDHKFDPITTEDYYALAGIFKSTQTMDNFKVVAKWHERPAITEVDRKFLAKRQAAMAATKKEIDDLIRKASEKLVHEARGRAANYLQAAKELQRYRAVIKSLRPLLAKSEKPPGLILLEAENFARGNVKKDFAGYGAKIGVIYNKGALPNVAEYDVSVQKTGPYQLDIRYAAAAARPVKLFVGGKAVKSDAAGKVTGSWYPDTQKWSVEGVFRLNKGKNTVRLECAGPFPHFDKLAIAPIKLPGGFKTAQQLATENDLLPVFLRQWTEYIQRIKTLPTGDALQKIVIDAKGPFALPDNAEAYYPSKVQESLRQLRSRLASFKKSTPKAPMAMAVTERAIVDVRVHIRGSHLTLGEVVPRRFPEILAGRKQKPIGAKQSGRLQLARWLTRPDHPLTSRVMVNRIWQGHFGTGLVRSPNNFGLLGERPTHQPLLDWLAVYFVKNGWSIKKVHRLIMLSATYQQASGVRGRESGVSGQGKAHRRRSVGRQRSVGQPQSVGQLDPENRLYRHFNRRRLEAEALRDALLMIGGQLDRTIGGSILEAKPRAYVTGTANSNYEKYDSNRRSIYLPVVRSALYDVFQAFDFPDPSFPAGKRFSTTVPSQALFLMNSDFVAERTKALARALLELNASDAERVAILYRKLYSRNPSPSECERSLRFVQKIADVQKNGSKEERILRGWQSLCRVLLSANEFVYVE